MNKINDEIARELQELGTPTLVSSSRDPGFRVPKGYFESFQLTLEEKIKTEEKTSSPAWYRVISIQSTWAIAASFLLLVALSVSWFLLRNNNQHGFLGDTQDFIYDDYFARVSEMDRSLMFDLLLSPEIAVKPEDPGISETEDDYLLDYLLDAVHFNGIEPIDLIAQPGNDHQH